LTGPGVKRIAIAKPELAPYGRAAVEALTASGLIAQVRDKLVYGENVSQALQYAESGNAEAAFIPLALTRRSRGEFIQIDERLHRPLDQALAAVSASPRLEAARRLADFIAGEEGRRALEKYGYTVP
jgi:molybdate transport system substrate-binding protein